MTTPQSNIIEETWWEVTTSTGLILRLPAPLKRTAHGDSVAMPPLEAMNLVAMNLGARLQSQSAITKKDYAVNLRDAVLIKTELVRMDPERYQQALLKASRRLSGTSSDAGPVAASPSADQASPSGRSTGGTSKRRTLH